MFWGVSTGSVVCVTALVQLLITPKITELISDQRPVTARVALRYLKNLETTFLQRR